MNLNDADPPLPAIPGGDPVNAEAPEAAAKRRRAPRKKAEAQAAPATAEGAAMAAESAAPVEAAQPAA
ncbi:MAG: hypothetical protein KGL43_10850, partial [Burkholderiales bacterium]|nr:hypothetical protein [Burkholderiales bacterium]